MIRGFGKRFMMHLATWRTVAARVLSFLSILSKSPPRRNMPGGGLRRLDEFGGGTSRPCWLGTVGHITDGRGSLVCNGMVHSPPFAALGGSISARGGVFSRLSPHLLAGKLETCRHVGITGVLQCEAVARRIRMYKQPPLDLLEDTHVFPGPYMFKVIGLSANGFVARTVAAVREELAGENDPPHRVRETSHGRHIAVTPEPTLQSPRPVPA